MIFPLDGVINPTNVLSVVVFPQPEGPKKVKNSPSIYYLNLNFVSQQNHQILLVYLET